MHLFQAQPANRLLHGKNLRIEPARAISRIAAFLAAMLHSGSRMEARIASRYEGRAWSDSTEREFNDDTAKCRRPRF